jgi:hypothetical protein
LSNRSLSSHITAKSLIICCVILIYMTSIASIKEISVLLMQQSQKWPIKFYMQYLHWKNTIMLFLICPIFSFKMNSWKLQLNMQIIGIDVRFFLSFVRAASRISQEHIPYTATLLVNNQPRRMQKMRKNLNHLV